MTTTVEPRIIHLQQLTHADDCETILGAFDALAPGESLVVVGSQKPGELLGRLQAERKGIFEWSPLEIGPSRFRVELTRRWAGRGARRTVTEALAWDHDRLDALEQRAFQLLEVGDAAGACATWADFTFGLRRHIRFEEAILFPAFEERVGIPAASGPTAVMRVEHREIESLIEAIGRALAGAGDPLPLQDDLHELLGHHNIKEERVLYPGADECLGSEESDALVARIQVS